MRLVSGSRQEYEKLKKTQPSHRDRYDLLDISLDAESEWMMYYDEDVGAIVQRKSDGQEFCLGLSEIEATDKKSRNYELLDDYSVWFVNSR